MYRWNGWGLALGALVVLVGATWAAQTAAPPKAMPQAPVVVPPPAGSVAATIRQMTGARTRMVWIQAPEGQGHPFGPSSTVGGQPVWKIVAFDTDDGGKERYLTPEPGVWNHAMITPTGTRVSRTEGLVPNGGEKPIWIVDWDGKNKRKLLDGAVAVGVAEDPPGTEWVYVISGPWTGVNAASVSRYQIDAPTKKELVWDKTLSNDKWEFTRDGKYGVGSLPSPNVGVVQLPNGPVVYFGVGYTPGVANDLSCMFHMILKGNRGIVMYDGRAANPHRILFSDAPDVAGTPDPQFWWTSFVRYDSRFFTFSGPHPGMTPTNGDIWFGQFTPNHDGVALWVRVTNSPELETQPYAWIEPPGARRKPLEPAATPSGQSGPKKGPVHSLFDDPPKQPPAGAP